MATQIKSPELDSTTPPYFSLDVGHRAKVFSAGRALWVKIIDIRGDEFLGIVGAGEPQPVSDQLRKEHELRGSDVISFERHHIFGMF